MSAVNVTLDSTIAANDPSTWTVAKKGAKYVATDVDGTDRVAHKTKKDVEKDIAGWQSAFDADVEHRASLQMIVDAALARVNAPIVPAVDDAPAIVSAPEGAPEQTSDAPESAPPSGDELPEGYRVLSPAEQMAELERLEAEEAAEKAANKRTRPTGDGVTGTRSAPNPTISVAERVAVFIRRITKDYDSKTVAEARALILPLSKRAKPDGSGDREVWRHQGRFIAITEKVDGAMKMSDLRSGTALLDLVTANLSLTGRGPSATSTAGSVPAAAAAAPVAPSSKTDLVAFLQTQDASLTIADVRARLIVDAALDTLSWDFPALPAAAAEQTAGNETAANV